MTSNNVIWRCLVCATLVSLLFGCRTPSDGTHSTSLLSGQAYPTKKTIAAFSHKPQKIALLLPLTGQHAHSAKAVREGFMASYYNSANHHHAQPALRIYDTGKLGVRQAYDTALKEGADFIVGPLGKEEVLILSDMSVKNKTPVLALNAHPSVHRPPANFIQFSLSPETEAQQLAERARQSGYHNASVMVPDTAWGKRIANAFSSHWEAMGGQIIQTVALKPSDDPGAAVQQLLGVDESQKRGNQIKRMLSEKVQFEPRRRSDLDVIILAATPQRARQLKPLFNFYYAEELPVYATSSVYSATPNPKRDRDLEGIVFCDMPGLLDPHQSGLSRLASTNGHGEHSRLFAMGVDAHQLATQLHSAHHMPFKGVTGDLSLGSENRIHRRLACAKMTQGVPVIIR